MGTFTTETQSCMLSASSTLHSSVQRVRAVGMLDRVPAWLPAGPCSWKKSSSSSSSERAMMCTSSLPTSSRARPRLCSGRLLLSCRMSAAADGPSSLWRMSGGLGWRVPG